MFKGLHDGRTGVMVPEVKDGQVTGITLLHTRFVPLTRRQHGQGRPAGVPGPLHERWSMP